MSDCETCGREDGHYLGCANAPGATAPTEIAASASETLAAIRREHLDEVVSSILAAVGTDQMGELYGALDDLIHEHYEPYSWLDEPEKAAWRKAVAEKLGGEGYGDPKEPVPAECTFEGCSAPRRSADKRVKFCETHSDPKNRK